GGGEGGVGGGGGGGGGGRVGPVRSIRAFGVRGGCESGISQSKSVQGSTHPQGRRRVRGPSAETCRDWNVLLKQKIAGLQASNTLASSGNRLENQLFVYWPALLPNPARYFESLCSGSAQRQHVAKIGAHQPALDL